MFHVKQPVNSSFTGFILASNCAIPFFEILLTLLFFQILLEHPHRFANSITDVYLSKAETSSQSLKGLIANIRRDLVVWQRCLLHISQYLSHWCRRLPIVPSVRRFTQYNVSRETKGITKQSFCIRFMAILSFFKPKMRSAGVFWQIFGRQMALFSLQLAQNVLPRIVKYSRL